MHALRFTGTTLELIDQTLLPDQEHYIICRTHEDVAQAIERMKVRGAPAIGAAAAYGIALAACLAVGADWPSFERGIHEACDRLSITRPTAVNLFWAIERMRRVLSRFETSQSVPEAVAALVDESKQIAHEDVETNRRIGQHGLALIPQGAQILTHCNTGSLATVEYGTALGVIRAAHEAGRGVHVYADETRPYLQGARLTAYELSAERIPVTVITDSAAATLMAQGRVDLVIVGADRIARNGDTANKIGTYGLAVLAHAHGIPFYVAAPLTTFDGSLASGEEIKIEERSPDEVLNFLGRRIAPEGVSAYNPAFDVTPCRLITGIITERGVVRDPDETCIRRLLEGDRPA